MDAKREILFISDGEIKTVIAPRGKLSIAAKAVYADDYGVSRMNIKKFLADKSEDVAFDELAQRLDLNHDRLEYYLHSFIKSTTIESRASILEDAIAELKINKESFLSIVDKNKKGIKDIAVHPNNVVLLHESGVTRKCSIGFSWTAFFFGAFPYFFRGLPLQGFLWLIFTWLATGAIFSVAIPLLGLVGFLIAIPLTLATYLIVAFRINDDTIRIFLEKGYKPSGAGWDSVGNKLNIKNDFII